VRMATESRWRARRIQAELSKLGIRVSLATVSRYLPRTEPDPGQRQRWTTFLRNHRDLIAGMDFFVVPTVRFQLLYVWFAIDHGRREILHFNVTANPTARWVIQQLRDAFPDDPAHRYLILDNDAIFSAEVDRSVKTLGIIPTRTSFQSPWQNGVAERFVGSVRRELLDRVIVLGEDHLRQQGISEPKQGEPRGPALAGRARCGPPAAPAQWRRGARRPLSGPAGSAPPPHPRSALSGLPRDVLDLAAAQGGLPAQPARRLERAGGRGRGPSDLHGCPDLT